MAAMAADATVTAENVDGLLQLTAKNVGVDFTVESAVTNTEFAENTLESETTTENGKAAEQVATIDIGEAAWDIGDVISGTIDGQEFSYTVKGAEDENIAQAVAQAVADALGDEAAATVAVEGTVITITAKVAGAGFELVTEVTNIAGVENTVDAEATTGNVAAEDTSQHR